MESGSPKTSTKTRRCSSAFPSYFCSRGANLSQGAGVEHRLPRVPKGTATATRRGPRGRPERGGKGGAHSRTPETLTVGRREDANILGEEEKKKKKGFGAGLGKTSQPLVSSSRQCLAQLKVTPGRVSSLFSLLSPFYHGVWRTSFSPCPLRIL